MGKTFITLSIGIIFSISLLANKLEMTANSVYSTQDTVHADNGVVVYYNNTIIKAKRATYNKKTKRLVFDDQVEIIGYQGTKEFSQHMELQTDTEEAVFKQLFLGGDNDIWILTEKAHKTNNIYKLGHSMLSSCDVKNPLWKMVFADAVYDQDDEYMKVYNARIHFWDIPIFYTPYLAFSTNKKRSSGLLFPKLGYIPTEGILYEQPIFWNLADTMDLEFNPQIRTKRSMGIYSTFRFVDSNHSKGTIRAGYFKDTQNYIDTFKPLHESHFGLEFNYESSKVFTSEDSSMTDGFYLNTTYLNDIDYLNLQKSRLSHFGTRPRQESRINYFLYNDSYYSGINAKYFIDTRAENNDETLQQLPSLQWHKYLDTLFVDNLTYSFDAHFNNVTRSKGSTMKQAEIKVPLEYSFSFFDDFVNMALRNTFYYTKNIFSNDVFKNDNFQYYSNIQSASLFTDLTKQYDSFIHVVQPSLEYVSSGNDKQSPVSFEALEEKQKALFAVGLPEETMTLGLKQYIYDEDMNLIFSQRLSQKYYSNRENKLSELHNEMVYIWNNWKFYNYFIYSHEFSDIDSLSTSIEIKEDKYQFDLSHSFKKKLTSEENSIASNDMNFNFQYNLNNRVRFNGGLSYDIENKESTQWRMGVGYFRDCWSIDTSLRRDIRATSRGSETLNTFYLQLNFIPFGGLGTGDFD